MSINNLRGGANLLLQRRRMIMGQFGNKEVPNNEVWYYADAKLTLNTSTGVQSHTFENGKGVLTFANAVTYLDTWFRSITTSFTLALPLTITSVAAKAFDHTSGLSWEVDLPSLTTLNQTCFYMSGITSIVNLGSISTIPESDGQTHGVFHGCASLTEVTLPATLRTMGKNCFYNVYNCKFVCLATTPPVFGDSAINRTPTAIYVPDESVDDYKAASGWSTYASKIHGLSEQFN